MESCDKEPRPKRHELDDFNREQETQEVPDAQDETSFDNPPDKELLPGPSGQEIKLDPDVMK